MTTSSSVGGCGCCFSAMHRRKKSPAVGRQSAVNFVVEGGCMRWDVFQTELKSNHSQIITFPSRTITYQKWLQVLQPYQTVNSFQGPVVCECCRVKPGWNHDTRRCNKLQHGCEWLNMTEHTCTGPEDHDLTDFIVLSCLLLHLHSASELSLDRAGHGCRSQRCWCSCKSWRSCHVIVLTAFMNGKNGLCEKVVGLYYYIKV